MSCIVPLPEPGGVFHRAQQAYPLHICVRHAWYWCDQLHVRPVMPLFAANLPPVGATSACRRFPLACWLMAGIGRRRRKAYRIKNHGALADYCWHQICCLCRECKLTAGWDNANTDFLRKPAKLAEVQVQKSIGSIAVPDYCFINGCDELGSGIERSNQPIRICGKITY